MDRHTLADHIVVADLEVCSLTFELQILRFQSDRREGEHSIVAAHPQGAAKHHMREQLAVLTNDHPWPDYTKRSNFAGGGDLRVGINDGCGMNHAGRVTS